MCEAPSIPITRHEWRQFLDSRGHGSRVHDLVLRRLVGYTPPMRHYPIVILITFAATSASAAEYTAHVIGISEGDTLTVLRDGRTQVKIRLHGVNAPETRPRPKMLRRTRPLLTRGAPRGAACRRNAGRRPSARARPACYTRSCRRMGRAASGKRTTTYSTWSRWPCGLGSLAVPPRPVSGTLHRTPDRTRTHAREGAYTRVRILKKPRGGCSA